MKVLLVHDYGTDTGGAEHQVMRLKEGLHTRGHDVRLFACRAEPKGGPNLADATCFGTEHPKLIALTRVVNISAQRSLRRMIRDFNPDVVHVRMFLHQLSPLILGPLREVPAVYQAVWYKAVCPRATKLLPDGMACEHTAGFTCLRHRCVTPQTWVCEMAARHLLRRGWSAFDAVTGLSRSVKDRLEAEGLGPVEVIPNGVTPRPMRAALSGPPLAVYAGRLVPEKGVHILIDAFARIARTHADARLMIVGDGIERQRLEGLTESRGVAGRITFAGYLSRAEMEQRFERAWIQVAPHLWAEPFGNVVTEAMMRGTAVITSDIGGPAEVIDDHATGRLVPPADAAALAMTLSELLGDRDACERLGAAAHEIACREYSPQRVVDRYLNVYARAIATHARRNPAHAIKSACQHEGIPR